MTILPTPFTLFPLPLRPDTTRTIEYRLGDMNCQGYYVDGDHCVPRQTWLDMYTYLRAPEPKPAVPSWAEVPGIWIKSPYWGCSGWEINGSCVQVEILKIMVEGLGVGVVTSTVVTGTSLATSLHGVETTTLSTMAASSSVEGSSTRDCEVCR